MAPASGSGSSAVNVAGEREGRIPLGPGREFDLIRLLLEGEGALPPAVLVGPGDDGAVLESGWVLSSDLSVEGVHFRRDWMALEEIGYRSVTAALSDLAAMAAEPVGVLLSVALGAADPDGEAVRVRDGAREACRAHGAVLLGGDLSASPAGLLLDVVVVGRAARPLLRKGSGAGDALWVTGLLGGSAAAVRLWKGGDEPSPALRNAFCRPPARVREALWLAERAPLHALIDLSDGLAGDAGHLAAASGVRILLESEAIPMHPEVLRLFPRDEALDLALSGGEDYELCFSAPPGSVELLAAPFEAEFGIPLTRVGTVVEGEGVGLTSAAGELEDVRALSRGGYSHFSEEEG